MTVSYSPQAFEKSRVLRPAGESLPERDRLVSIAVTIAVHVLIAIAALTTVQVVRPKVMQELSVQITPERPKPPEEPKQLPKLAPPAPVTAPVPEVVIQTAPPPPVIAQPPVPPIAPSVPVPATAPQGTGEGRDSFLARLLAQLNRVKQYPRAARQARIEGVVMLHFVMDAQGKLVSFEIAKSSGRPVLDNEALALIQRAQLPPLPPGFPTNTLDAVVPIQFSLDN
jgi:periplasmic protein TonB